MTTSTFHELTTEERRLIDRLLEEPFPGQSEIRRQLAGAQARAIDPGGSLELRAANGVTADVVHRVPVEAEYDDEDSVIVHVLLHVVEGRIAELEFYKDDGSAILRRPAPADLRVTHASA